MVFDRVNKANKDLKASIQRHLEDAQTRALKLKGRVRKDAANQALTKALKELVTLGLAYHERLVEQVHSVRISQITEDLERLIEHLRPLRLTQAWGPGTGDWSPWPARPRARPEGGSRQQHWAWRRGSSGPLPIPVHQVPSPPR